MVKYLAIGAPVTVGVAGVSVYLAGQSDNSVASKIRSSISGKDYLQLVESKDSSYGVKFRELYKNFKGTKLNNVTEATLPSGCEETLKAKSSSKTKEEIDFAEKGCVVDTRSIKEATKGFSNKALISELVSGEQDAFWKAAGDYYKNNKETKNLEISDNTFTSTEQTTNVTGGPALQVGCASKESKLMYEYGGEDKTYEKYMTWCVKQ